MSFWNELEKVETDEKSSFLSNVFYYVIALLIAIGFGFVMVTILS